MNKLKVLLFERHLLLTNTTISCLQIGTADYIQQKFTGNGTWDWKQTLRMSAVGLVIAPMLHGFYRVLDSRRFTGSHKIVTLKKLSVDTLSLPIFSGTFMTVASMYEGKSLAVSFKEYKDKFWFVCKVDMIWPPVQLINFYFLPNSVRILYTNVISLIYNSVLSYIKNNDLKQIEHVII